MPFSFVSYTQTIRNLDEVKSRFFLNADQKKVSTSPWFPINAFLATVLKNGQEAVLPDRDPFIGCAIYQDGKRISVFKLERRAGEIFGLGPPTFLHGSPYDCASPHVIALFDNQLHLAGISHVCGEEDIEDCNYPLSSCRSLIVSAPWWITGRMEDVRCG
jgi:hypothetical protein